MAVREYVGARYVPIYVGEWDSTMQTTYEPLSIVTVANVGSYTSRRFVPVGVPITDTDYWIESAVLSGQITALTNRVNAIEDDIDDVTDVLLNQNRRIVTITDSYGEHPSVSDNWPLKLETMQSGVSYWYHIHQAGAGYYRPGHQITTYYNSVKSNIADMDTITDVIICLGQNDAAESITDVRTAAYNFYQEVHTDMPNARVWVGYPEAMTYLADTYLTNLINMIEGLQQIVSRLNYCTWMPGLEYIMHDTFMEDSGSPGHPNSTGATEIARGIGCFINGGSFKYCFNTNITADWGDGDTSSGFITVDGPISIINIGAITKLAQSISLTASGYTQVATLSSNRIINRSQVSLPCFVRDADTTTIYPAMARTNGNKLEIVLRQGTATIRPAIYEINLVMPTIRS